MQIFVRNYIRCEEATLDLDAAYIHLIAGRNGAGKTSALDAIECILTGSLFPTDRGVSKKVDVPWLITRGAKKATVRWLEETQEPGWDANVKLTKSDPSIESTGRPPVFDSILLGRQSLFRLPPKDRMRYLSDLLDINPTIDDLAAWLKGRGMKLSDRLKEALVEQIAEGWDAAHEQRLNLARIRKGEWKQITGETWGREKADGWEPGKEGIPKSLKESNVEALNEAIAEAQRVHDEALQQVGMDRQRRETLAAEAAKADDLATQARAANREAQAQQAKIDGINQKLADLPPIEGGASHSCPHCGEPIEVTWHGHEARVLSPSVEPLSEEERRKRIHDRHTLTEERDGLMATMRELEQSRQRLQFEADKAAQARDAVNADKGKSAEGEVMQQPRARLEEARMRKALFIQWRDAAEKHRLIMGQLLVAEGLSPDGVRAERIREKLAPVNAALAEMAEILRLDPAPVIEPDGSFTWLGDAMPYGMLSHSHRLRMDVMVGMALQECRDGENPRIILMDELEAVSRDDRKVILKAMITRRFRGILAQVADEPAKIPSTEKMNGRGVAYWMENGVMEQI